jgi:glycosyltransferase involved in cell wall biosynthesis
MAPRALVIVTTYERPTHLRRALEAWRRQTCLDFALTVADDGSGPETAAIVRAFAATAPFEVRHSWWEHRDYRRAGVLNEAVRRSGEGALLVFTDGDCVPPADHLARQLAVHARRTFHAGGAYALTPEATAALSVADVAAGRHETLPSEDDRRAMRVRARRTRWKTRLRRPRHPRVLGLNVALDRPLFEEVNGYDEAFVGWGHEDDDLRDRVLALRPRPRVRLLWGIADTIHLWHPPTPDRGAGRNAAYFGTRRPERCVEGLVDERGPRPPAEAD